MKKKSSKTSAKSPRKSTAQQAKRAVPKGRKVDEAQAGDAIEHVIVLMLENRSFDHMLGSLKSVYPPMEGIDPGNPGTNTDGATVYPQLPNASYRLPYGVDPKHELTDVTEQLSGNCGGFISNFIREYPKQKASAPQVMAYFDRSGPNRLPVLHALAESFTICDHWFSSVPGPTWPNRFFVHSGTAQGRVIMPSGLFEHWHAYDQDTIYDRLNEKGISWRVYYGDIAQSLMLAHQRQWKNASNYSAMNHFYADVKGQEADFPSYVFIEPLYFGGYENDQHPPANVLEGELLIARVYNAIRANAELWAKSLLVVLYDEHGGFYDHVYPPPAVPPDEHQEEYDFNQYGLRVPALLVSPFAPKGVVNTLFDHTSLLQFLQDKWGLGPLGKRMENANSFAGALLVTARTDTPASIPEPDTDVSDGVGKGRKMSKAPAGKADEPPINDLQERLLAFTQILETETDESGQVKAARMKKMVASTEDHVAVAKERQERFLEQQRKRAGGKR